MWLFPFYSAILKTNLDRDEVAAVVTENTFLSDAGYKRSNDKQKFFFGIVSRDEFSLETIQNQGKLANFFRGDIKGVDRDIFVFLSVRAFKFRRLYFLIMIFNVVCMGILGNDLYAFGPAILKQPGSLMFAGVILALWIYILYTGFVFQQKLRSSIDFFRGMLQADEVKKSEVPLIFRE